MTCYTLTIPANGPFDMIASCNGYQIPGDLAYQMQLFNGTGHLLDTLQEPCGSASQDVPTTVVIPESLAAGTYKLQMSVSSNAPVSVLILDASSS